MRGAGAEVQLEVAAIAAGNYNGVLRQREMRAVRCIRLRQEDAAPACGRGFDILNVENEMGEALVENTRLDSEGSLGGKHFRFEIVESAQG